MSLKSSTTKYTGTFSDKAEKVRRLLDGADAVMIGAGAGLSESAGLNYGGERFRRHFSDFEVKYGFHDMYSGGFYDYPSPEEYWAFWSRYVMINRYSEIPGTVYYDLLELMHGREYFILTTNVDHCFQRAGFEKERIFYTQGDYGLFQCSVPCRQETFWNEAVIARMYSEQKDMRVPSELIPKCPYCGSPMTMNLRADDRFVEDAGWRRAAKRCEDFVAKHENSRMLFLELGVGYNTPGIIKYPFIKMTLKTPDAAYVCVNREAFPVPEGIADRSVCAEGDIGEFIKELLAEE